MNRNRMLIALAVGGAFLAGRYGRSTSQAVAEFQSIGDVRSIAFEPVMISNPDEWNRSGEVVRVLRTSASGAHETIYSRPVTEGASTLIVPMTLNGNALRIAVSIPAASE